MFAEYLARWELTLDGPLIVTDTSRLLPVRQRGQAAMLKIALAEEEQRGGRLMTWWDGKGAARVLAQNGNALLLERAEGGTSLADLARDGRDDEASRIICAVVAKLHAPRKTPPGNLISLTQWFSDLHSAAALQGGILADSARTARELLATAQQAVVLHGDIHHGNILDFGERGWLAIDPKGLIGERGFDYANIFCNPDRKTATAPGRLARQVAIVADAAALDRKRLLQWILAWAGLSEAWRLANRHSSELDLTVAELASAELLR